MHMQGVGVGVRDELKVKNAKLNNAMKMFV